MTKKKLKKNHVFTKNRPFPRKDDIKGVMYLKKKKFVQIWSQKIE